MTQVTCPAVHPLNQFNGVICYFNSVAVVTGRLQLGGDGKMLVQKADLNVEMLTGGKSGMTWFSFVHTSFKYRLKAGFNLFCQSRRLTK